MTDPSPRDSGSPRRAAHWAPAAALLLYILLAVAMTWPLATQLTTAIPGDDFDGWQNYWNLWWMRRAWLEEHTSPYFTTLLYYPTGADLRFQTMAPFNGLTFLNLQLVGNVFLAYNAAVLFSFAVGGFGAYLLALYALRGRQRYHRRPAEPLPPPPGLLHGAAFLAGAVFAFSPYHFAHLLGHLQLITLQWIPFYALYLWRGLDRAATGQLRPRDVGMAALFLVLVGLSDWYYVMYCGLFTALALAAQLAGRRLRPAGVAFAGGVALLFVLTLSPLLVPMVQGTRTWQGTSLLRDYSETITLSADLLAFVTPQVFHPLWGEWAAQRSAVFSATRSEFTVFAGYTVLALAVAGLASAPRRRSGSAFWALAAGLFAVLALGPILHVGGRTPLLPNGQPVPLPYALLYETVPFIKYSRSVSRFDVMVMLCLGVAAAFGVAAVGNWLRARGRSAGWVAPLATALVLFEFLAVPYPMSPPDTPPWYYTLAQSEEPGAVLNLPANWSRPGYLLYQTVHGKPMSTGYVTRDDPNTLPSRAPVIGHFFWLGPDVHTRSFDLAAHGVQVLHDLLEVRWVVLDRYKMPGGLERTYTEAAAAEIFNAAGQAPVYEDERLTVYQVPPPTQRRPYVILGVEWPPRETDDAGEVWRRLPANGAGLELVVPEEGPHRLTLDVLGQAGASLRLVAASGETVGEWTLQGGREVLRSPTIELGAGTHRLRLESVGSSPLTVYAVDVSAAR
ncbi:MAG: hypothetical protein NZ528_03860 [Caldilineales bacterium]|nr:hypothetical protein [Caldilineales bacterium]MDW8318647.1 hypothetical protein [Anaerolineae bacterium]